MSIAAEILYASPEGGTVDLRGEELPTDGYFVGGTVNPLVYDRDRDSHTHITSFIRHVRSQNLARFIGWWTDSETGKLWIDGVDWYQSLSAALVTARDRGEIAIYDVADQAEIRVSQ